MFKWPERRYAHAASHITGGTVFVMIGGCGSGGSTLNEVCPCVTPTSGTRYYLLSH